MKGKKRAKIRFPLSLRIQNPAALPSKSSQRFFENPFKVLPQTLERFARNLGRFSGISDFKILVSE